jgi:hypothetical protein
MIKYFITAIDDDGNNFKVWLQPIKTHDVLVKENNKTEKCLVVELEETNVPKGVKI